MITSSIRDNRKRGSVGAFLKENITPDSQLSFVSAYFTVFAFQSLQSELSNIKKLDFLFGEPTFINAIGPKDEHYREYQIVDDSLSIPLERRLTQSALARQCAEWISEKVEIKSMVKPNFLHGKMYHITHANGVEKACLGSSNFTVNGLALGQAPNIELNMVIDNDRDRQDLKEWFYELWNSSEDIIRDVKAEVLQYLEKLYTENSPRFVYYKTLYHLFNKFILEQKQGDLLTRQSGFFESEIWNKLYDFQKDGVKGAINKILKHNGCILADSVGLGKTFEALAVIKYFESLNQRVLVICPKKLSENWTIYQAVQANSYNPFVKDRFSYTVIYHTDLTRESGFGKANNIDLSRFNWGAFDLIVIDESHNFKGNPMQYTEEDNSTRMNRAAWLMEKIIKSGVKTKVLLLSATPVNNDLRDLRNQIFLITEGKSNALSESAQIPDIAATLKNAQSTFSQWVNQKETAKLTVTHLLEKLDSSFFTLLDEMTIARSRKHIKSFYKVEEKEKKFPERLKPVNVTSEIDSLHEIDSYDSINSQISSYSLAIFNPSRFVKDEYKTVYEVKAATKGVRSFTQSVREKYLIEMLKINYLKRLESSVNSFRISIRRILRDITQLQERIEHAKAAEGSMEIASDGHNSELIPDPLSAHAQVEKKGQDDLFSEADGVTSKTKFAQSVSSLFKHEDYELPDDLDFEEDEEDDQLYVGKKLRFRFSHLKLQQWQDALESDKRALTTLLQGVERVTPDRDAKLRQLRELISSKVSNPLQQNNKKVIVFTAYSDTAIYLYDHLNQWVQKELGLHIAMVTGTETRTTFGKNDFNAILTNFSPIAKERNLFNSKVAKTIPVADSLNTHVFEDQIDILLATDCISEGQNLQDCDYLINYDIHWNPIRLIQRFGRIDRLGSVNGFVQMVNFWPTNDLEAYINLKKRVESRMTMVDLTASADDNILNPDFKHQEISEDLQYRSQQLLRLREEVLDLEEMNESLSLTDLTLDDFRIELMNFLDANRDQLENAPLGLYALVPAPDGAHSHLCTNPELNATEREIMKPGIIFCLRQKNSIETTQKVNPLQPYFLIYIREDGTVRFNFTSPKQILGMYRSFCSNASTPYKELCDIFNQETENGMNTIAADGLLKKSMAAISSAFTKRNLMALTGNDPSAVIIPQSKTATDGSHFELITWLIIR